MQINGCFFFNLTLPCFINVYQRTKLYQYVMNDLTFQTRNWQPCHLEKKAQKCGKLFGRGVLQGYFPSSDIWILIWLSGTSVASAGLTALLPDTFTIKLPTRLAYVHPVSSHPCILACHWFLTPLQQKGSLPNCNAQCNARRAFQEQHSKQRGRI